MILTIILISLPVGIISFFFSKKIYKKLGYLFQKIDTFPSLNKFKDEIITLYRAKFAGFNNHFNKEKIAAVKKNEQDFLTTIDEIIKPSSSKRDYLEKDLVIDEEDKVMFLKKKKLLEKIIYDALVLRKEGKLDIYEKKIIEWLAIDSEDKDLNRLLSDLYFNLGNYKKALPILKKIVELDPKDHKAIWQIGEIYLTSWDFDIAELLIQKAIGINPSNPKYYISMVELLYNTDRKQDAIQEMEKVIKLRPTHSAYMLTLADLYEETGDIDNAKKYYFRVLEYEPSNEKAKKKLKQVAWETN